MKTWRALLWSASVALLCVSGTLHAADFKVGFVNTAKVLEEAPQAEEARKKLESEFAPRDKALVDAQKALKQLEDKLSTDANVMSDAKRTDLERDILSHKREIKRSREEFREDFNIRRNEELGKLQRLVIQAIVALARDEKYDMIVGDNSVLFASERVDITEKVLQRLRDEHKNSAAGKADVPAKRQ